MIFQKLLPGDLETESQGWYAGLRFYGNNPEHSLNADMCNFLADLPVSNLFAILYSFILNF